MYLLLRSDKVNVPIQWYKFDCDFEISISEEPEKGPDDLLRVVVHSGLNETLDRVSVSVHNFYRGVDVFNPKGELIGVILTDRIRSK